MEKTIEEKDAAVLAELSRLSELHAVQAPEWPEWKAFKWREDYFTISRGEDQERVRLDYLGATCERGFHPEITNQFYRLLGLETAQAVPELKSKIRALEGSIDSEVRIIKNLSVENRELKTQIKEIKAENERHLTEVEDLWRRKLDAVVQLPIVEYATDSEEVAAIKRELKAERAKSAKLVEALESLRRNRTLDRFMIETFIDQALEAHKKGGANG